MVTVRVGKGAKGAIVAVAVASLIAASAAVRAAGVKNANPYWFQDGYHTTQYVSPSATSAIVDTAGTGTVYLPPLSADAMAYAPAYVGADILEVATANGVRGWGFDGAAMVREPFLDVPVSQPAGVAFLGQAASGQAALGVRLAVGGVSGPASGVGIYGWNGATWAHVLSVSTPPGLVGVAAGADGGVLAATSYGMTLYGPTGTSEATIAGLAGVRGVASAANGSLVAVWTAATASFYAWDGHAYRALSSLDAAAPGGGTLIGVAPFRGGNGYWLITPTQAVAYGWDGAAMTWLPQWGMTTMPANVVAAATGWADTPGGLALLSASGVRYMAAPAGTESASAARRITGQSWPVFAPTAQLQSTLLSIGHNVTEVKMVDSMAALPGSATIDYAVSTDGGGTWTTTPPLQPTDVPAGSQLMYRALLGTSNQAQTPVLDATNLYEIATQVSTQSRSVAWLLP